MTERDVLEPKPAASNSTFGWHQWLSIAAFVLSLVGICLGVIANMQPRAVDERTFKSATREVRTIGQRLETLEYSASRPFAKVTECPLIGESGFLIVETQLGAMPFVVEAIEAGTAGPTLKLKIGNPYAFVVKEFQITYRYGRHPSLSDGYSQDIGFESIQAEAVWRGTLTVVSKELKIDLLPTKWTTVSIEVPKFESSTGDYRDLSISISKIAFDDN